MQTDFLRYLIKIVECGSMNKAANDLFITQAALTKAMKKLETDLNCELLKRTKNGVKLTEKGKRVYADAEKILAIEDSWKDLADHEAEVSGTVRLALINSVNSSVIDHFLINYRKQYANVIIIPKEYRDYDFLKQFENKKADIGISCYIDSNRARVYDCARKLDLEAVELCRDKFYVFMGANNPLREQPTLTTKDLKDSKLLLYSDEKDIVSTPFFADFFKKENIFFMNNMQNMIRTVMTDDVVIFNTKLFAQQNEYVVRGEVIYREVTDIQVPTVYYLLRPKILTPAERIVIDLLKATLQDLFNKVEQA